VEQEQRRLEARCDAIVAGGLSVGAVLAIHHAARHPDSVSGLALYAPSLRLDGWGIPWYASLFSLVTMRWCADCFAFAERHPWGVKDSRLRALIAQAITSGDSSRAGIAALPGSMMLELRWLVQCVRREIGEVRQPALIMHPREDDRASLRNLHDLQDNLGGLVETVVLDDSYHLITLDRQRQVVVGRTLEFAARLQRGTFHTRALDLDDLAVGPSDQPAHGPQEEAAISTSDAGPHRAADASSSGRG
jgi:carboxylesterase